MLHNKYNSQYNIFNSCMTSQHKYIFVSQKETQLLQSYLGYMWKGNESYLLKDFI